MPPKRRLPRHVDRLVVEAISTWLGPLSSTDRLAASGRSRSSAAKPFPLGGRPETPGPDDVPGVKKKTPTSIKHIEDLPPEARESFARKLRAGELEVSEKVDGSCRISFGMRREGACWNLWTRSKHGDRVFETDGYEDVPRNRALREAHAVLQDEVRFRNLIPDGIELVADVLHTPVPNVIPYGPNAIVIHGALGPSGPITGEAFWSLVTPIVEATGGALRFPRGSWLLRPKAIVEGFSADLAGPKEAIVRELARVKSAFGAPFVEGLVLTDSAGNMAKVVDRKRFTELNAKMWYFRERIENGVRGFDKLWKPGVMASLKTEIGDAVIGLPVAKTPGFVRYLARYAGTIGERRATVALMAFIAENRLMADDYVSRLAIAEARARISLDELHDGWGTMRAREPHGGMDEHNARRTDEAFADAYRRLDRFNHLVSELAAMEEDAGRVTLMREFLDHRYVRLERALDEGPSADAAAGAFGPGMGLLRLEPKFKDVMQKSAEKLKAKGIDVAQLKRLGAGGNGIAYDMGGNRVFKVTMDGREARASNHILGKRFKHIALIDDVFRFRDTMMGAPLYGIVQEKLEPMSQKEKLLLDRVISIIEVGVHPETNDEFIRAIRNSENLFKRGHLSEEEFENFKKALAFFQIPDILRDLKAANVEFGDWHSGNLMRRGSEFVLIDLGVSSSPGGEPDVLERVTEAVIATLGEEKADRVGFTIGRFQPFHKGHAEIIRRLAKKFTKVIVVVAGNKRDRRNPFSFDLRVEMMKRSLPDVASKLEVYKAEADDGRASGYIPGIITRIIRDKNSSIEPETAVTILVGPDRIGAVKQQIAHAIAAKEAGGSKDEYFDPGLFFIEEIPELAEDGTRVSGTDVRSAVANDERDKVEKLLDPHVVTDPEAFDELYGRMRKELVNESLIREFLIDIADSEEEGEKLLGSIVDKNAALLKKRGISVQGMKKLGTGSNGTAFRLADGKILKVTTDDAETFAAAKLRGKKFEHLYVIHDVFAFPGRFNGHVVYGVVQEGGLEKPSREESKEFDRLFNLLDAFVYDDDIASGDFENVIAKMAADPDYRDDVEVVKKLAKKFDITGMGKDLHAAGIKFLDYHGGNFMKRGDKYVLIDLGTPNSPGSKRPQELEEKLADVGEGGIDRTLFANREALKRKGIDVDTLLPLGHGEMGQVYEIGGNKVLKVTTDKDEAQTAVILKQKGRNLKHVVKVFDAFTFGERPGTGTELYGIVCELVEPAGEMEQRLFDELVNELTFYKSQHEEEMLTSLATRSIEDTWALYRQFVEDDIRTELAYPKDAPRNPKKEDRLRRIFQQKMERTKDGLAQFQFFEMVEELKSVGIQYADYHGGNVGKRGKDWVVLDVGMSRGGSTLPPVLEALIPLLVAEVGVPAGPTSFAPPTARVQSSPWSSGQVIEPDEEDSDRLG